MVNIKPLQESKRVDKKPASSIIKPTAEMAENIKVPVSPKGSPLSVEDELHALRTRNKMLTGALKAIKETAEEERKKHQDLVWLARNRGRYPLHPERKRIERQHSEELEKLKTPEGDYHHGIHAGILATTRMFEKQAESILSVEEQDDIPPEALLSVAKEHEQVVKETKEAFPEVTVDSKPMTA